jgi:hypothetical protein
VRLGWEEDSKILKTLETRENLGLPEIDILGFLYLKTNKTIMRFFDILYYRYFLVYSKKWIMESTSPHLNTIFLLSVLESLIINMGIEYYLTTVKCRSFDFRVMIFIWLIVTFINYIVYGKMGRGERVVLRKPKLFDSEVASTWLSILFFIFSVSLVFWMPVYTKKILEHCN